MFGCMQSFVHAVSSVHVSFQKCLQPLNNRLRTQE